MIFLDFEYRATGNHPNLTELVSVVAGTSLETLKFYRLDNTWGRVKFQVDMEALCLKESQTFVVYTASADLPCLYQLGICPKKVIDLWTEAKMFMLTHPKYFTSETGLLSACKEFGVIHDYAEEKDSSRYIIINNTNYTAEQWKIIEEYNRADVRATIQLFHKLQEQWAKWGIKNYEVLARGEFSAAVARSFYTTKGFPIDVEYLKIIEDNSETICNGVREATNKALGVEIYKKKKAKGVWSYVFSNSAFAVLIENLGLGERWKKTKTGKYSTEEEVLLQEIEGFVSENKTLLVTLHEAMQTIKVLSKKKESYLSNFLTADGHINPPPFPFHQKSSRSSPKPSKGFILNLSPWLRTLIKPKPGRCFIGCDWGKQEMVIAGTLSKDPVYLGDVTKGDIYLEMAKLCGEEYCPASATKKTHGALRDKFKGIVLGIQYGKGLKSLQQDMRVIFGVDDSEALRIATNLMNNHKQKYPGYWEWITDVMADSMPGVPIRGAVRSNNVGAYITIDGWYYFTSNKTRPTQLMNIPLQSNGAAIMRRGYIHAVNAGLDVVCSLHDALYIDSSLDMEKENLYTLKSCMKQGVEDILGKDAVITNEEKITYSNYVDRRGELILNKLKDFSEEVCSPLHTKISDILTNISKGK